VQRGELDGISNKYKGIDALGEFKMLYCSVLGARNWKTGRSGTARNDRHAETMTVGSWSPMTS